MLPIMKEMLTKIKIARHIKHKYPNVSLLMKGRHRTNSRNTSILHFTVHRCASQFVMQIFKIIEKHSDMTQIELEGYFWNGGKLCTSRQEIYKKCGYLYGPFYGLDKEELTLPIPNLADFKIVLMLRDPRDVLTSYYFYQAFSSYDNPAQQQFLIARNEKVKNTLIDNWVLEKAPLFKARYEEYLKTLHGRSNVLFLKYEDMVADFESWFYKLIGFSGLHLERQAIESIFRIANFSVENEDKNSHKRQVTPGDHVRKLKQETIDALNSEFQAVLEGFKF
jgi:Sulfotransferase domain